MKVLILQGSPRPRGNSSLLCDQFEKGASDAGACVARLNVAGMKVAGCLGCDACRRGGGSCVQKDDMEAVRDEMLSSDAIVLSSPIYFYSICSQLKALIDRTYAFVEELSGKTFYFLITCAAPSESYTETMVAALRGFTCCVPSAKEGGIVIGMGSGKPGDVKASPAFGKAYDLGKECARQAVGK